MTISKQFLDSATNRLRKVAVIIDDKEYTYARLLTLIQQQANILRLNGFERGDHLMIKLQGIDFIVMMIAAADMGLILVPVNPDATQETVQNIAISTDTPIIISEGFEANDSTFSTSLRFKGRLEDLYLLITTSGSTGDPKPIVLTQETKLARMNALIDLYDINKHDITLICTPLYHSMAQRVILASLITGGTLVIQQKWSAQEFARLVMKYQVTFSVPVASQIKQIANEILLIGNSLRRIVSSSALLEPITINKMRTLIDCPIHNCYGTSEIAIATNRNSESQIPFYSVGVATQNIDIKISDAGEILVNTPLLFDGYYGKRQLTQDSMAYIDNIDGKGKLSARGGAFFKTGDLGELDANGNLIIRGRIKELINVGGDKVYPEDIESILLSNSDIEECAAFACKDDKFGEIVAVAIVSKHEFTLNEIQTFCIDQLTDAQLPRRLFHAESLARTESGKLKRVAIASYYGE